MARDSAVRRPTCNGSTATRPQQARGDLLSIATESERTLFFDFLPLDLGEIHGYRVRFHLYTVPGQVLYERTRVAVLNGVDGIVFVVDSTPEKLEENFQSVIELETNMRLMQKDLGDFPFIMQWNKRDVPGAVPIPTLDRYLNRRRAPTFAASAVNGEGVFPTLARHLQVGDGAAVRGDALPCPLALLAS